MCVSVCVLMGSVENSLTKTFERMRVIIAVWHLSNYLSYRVTRGLFCVIVFSCVCIIVWSFRVVLRIRDKYIKSLAYNKEPSSSSTSSSGLQAEAHLCFSFCLIGKGSSIMLCFSVVLQRALPFPIQSLHFFAWGLTQAPLESRKAVSHPTLCLKGRLWTRSNSSR